MLIRIYLKDDYNKEDFVKFVIYRIKKRIIDNFKKLNYDVIIKKINDSNLLKLEDKREISAVDIFNQALKNIIYKQVDAHNWLIEIDPNKMYRDTHIKLINIIKLFEYGTSTFKPVLLIRESFKYNEERIHLIYKMYQSIIGE